VIGYRKQETSDLVLLIPFLPPLLQQRMKLSTYASLLIALAFIPMPHIFSLAIVRYNTWKFRITTQHLIVPLALTYLSICLAKPPLRRISTSDNNDT